MSLPDPTLHPETLALHGGQEPDPTTNARAVPIYQTTSYVFDDAEHAANLFALKEPGNIYTRIMNPTTDVLEQRHRPARRRRRRRSALASGRRPRRYAILNIASAGDEIVSAAQPLRRHLQPLRAHPPALGITVTFVDADDPEKLAAAIDDKTRRSTPRRSATRSSTSSTSRRVGRRSRTRTGCR